MPPEVAAEADPILEAARQFAAPLDPAVKPPPESTEKTEEVEAPKAKEGEDAGGAEPESQGETPAAIEGKDDDGAERLKALRELVDEDPALASVPAIRARLGLAPLPVEAQAPVPRGLSVPLVFEGKIPTEEEMMAAYTKRMEANDEVGAIKAVSAASTAPIAAAVQYLLEKDARDTALSIFKKEHPDWEKHEKALAAEVERRKALGKPIDLDDVWNAAVRPGPRPSVPAAEAAAAVKAAADKAKSDKTRAAASAAGAPTNQRAAGAPAPQRELTPSEKALQGILSKPREVPQLYDPAVLTRRQK